MKSTPIDPQFDPDARLQSISALTRRNTINLPRFASKWPVFVFAEPCEALHEGCAVDPTALVSDIIGAAGCSLWRLVSVRTKFPASSRSERTRDGIAAARKRGNHPGRPKLEDETVSALQELVEAGMTPGMAAKQLGMGRSTAYRITKVSGQTGASPIKQFTALGLPPETSLTLM